MPNTYTQIYIQIVFAVYKRKNLIPPERREELHKYITGIATKRKHKLLAIFAMPDHIHILVGFNDGPNIPDFVRDIKAGSSNFINKQNWFPHQFNWQTGYGAFSYSRSHVDRVVKYILNQEAHHQTKSFKQEYLKILKAHEVEYDERYLFEWMD